MTFDEALTFTLRWEGGYVNHPDDPGGATNMGITQRTYDAWRDARREPRRDVRELTRDEARQLYYERYWLPVGAPELEPALALAAFDAAVNSGVNRALSWLREHQDAVAYTANRLQFVSGLQIWPTFGRGWARRIAALFAEIARARGAAPTRPTEEAASLVILYDATGQEVARTAVPEGATVLMRADLDRRRIHVRPDAITRAKP